MAALLPERGPTRLVAAQLTIDESAAMATAAPREHARAAFWGTGVSIFVFWNLFTLLGALGAAQLGDPADLGLDALVPAAFLALLWPQVRSASRIAIAVAAALVALLALPFVPAGAPVLLAALVVLPLLVRR
jgi:predicted branched-subunit amino acid permease